MAFEFSESSGTPKCLATNETLRLGRGVETTVGEKFASVRTGVLDFEAICFGRSAREIFFLDILTKKEMDLR